MPTTTDLTERLKQLGLRPVPPYVKKPKKVNPNRVPNEALRCSVGNASCARLNHLLTRAGLKQTLQRFDSVLSKAPANSTGQATLSSEGKRHA
jgi:hypothetical protein